MISANAKTIQKSFTEQAQNFETKSMNFTKQEYLEHMISCVKPSKNRYRFRGGGRNLYLRAFSCPMCEKM